MALARQFEGDGEHGAAETCFSRALGLRPACPDVLAAYGLFLQNRGEHNRAEKAFRLSLQSNPTHLDTLQNYAIFLEEVRGDLDEAERLYAVALESTRDGLLEDIPTPTDAAPTKAGGSESHCGAKLFGDGARDVTRSQASASKTVHEPVTARVKQPQAREPLRENLQPLHRKSSVSGQGRIDAERRFAGDSCQIVPYDSAGTRHAKEHTGAMHRVPWQGPLDRPKSAKKRLTLTSSDTAGRELHVAGVVGTNRGFCADGPVLDGETAAETSGGPPGKTLDKNICLSAFEDKSDAVQTDSIADLLLHPSSSVESSAHSSPSKGASTDMSLLRYDPHTRLKLREAFTNIEKMQSSSTGVSSSRICTVLKTTLGLDLPSDATEQFMKHFCTDPGASGSTLPEEKRLRYDAFCEDVWRAIESTLQHSKILINTRLSAKHRQKPGLDTNFVSVEDGADAGVQKEGKISLRNWLQEAKVLNQAKLLLGTASTSPGVSDQPDMSDAAKREPDTPEICKFSENMVSMLTRGRCALKDKNHEVDSETHRSLRPTPQEKAAEPLTISQMRGESKNNVPSTHADIFDQDKKPAFPLVGYTGPLGRRPHSSTSESLASRSVSSDSTAMRCGSSESKDKITPAAIVKTGFLSAKDVDRDACFDQDSLYHPAQSSQVWRLETKGFHNATALHPKGFAKFELLRPQEQASTLIESDNPLGQQSSENNLSGIRMSCEGQHADSTRGQPAETPKSERIIPSTEALTNAHPASAVKQSNFRRRPRSDRQPVLPCDTLRVNEEVFTALRQRFHTVTMIYGYLNSRSAEMQLKSQGLSRKPESMITSSSKRKSIGKEDFKAAVAQLGLGLTEREIIAIYEMNADIRTGELSFNNVQRAIKGLNMPFKVQALPTPRPKSDRKRTKESDRIQSVLKQVWATAAEAFVFFDISGSDALNMIQLRAGLKRLRLNTIHVERAFDEIDLDNDGRISDRDFIRHFAPGWHHLGDFMQTQKDYEAVKAKGRQRVALNFQRYLDGLNRAEAAKSPLRSPDRSPQRSPARSPQRTPSPTISRSMQGRSPVMPYSEMHGSVMLEVKLDMTFKRALEIEEALKHGLKRDLAYSCQRDIKTVHVRKLRAGPDSSIIAMVVLKGGIDADDKTALEAATDLKGQILDESSSLLLCEYTSCALDIVIKEVMNDSDILEMDQTPLFVRKDNKKFSPVINGLDLHGVDGINFNRSNEPLRSIQSVTQFVLQDSTRKDGSFVEGLGKEYQYHFDKHMNGSKWSPRASQASEMSKQPLSSRNSSDTSELDENSEKHLDDSLHSALFYDAHSNSFHRTSSADNFHEREICPNSPAPHTVGMEIRDAGGVLAEFSQPTPNTACGREEVISKTDEDPMTGAKLAALRLQLRKEREREMRLNEKMTIREHRRMRMEKRRTQRFLQEAARLERSQLHKGLQPSNSHLRLFSRYNASQSRVESTSAPASPQRSSTDQWKPCRHSSHDKRPCEAARAWRREPETLREGGKNTLQRSVRWEPPQVQTYEARSTSHDTDGDPGSDSSSD